MKFAEVADEGKEGDACFGLASAELWLSESEGIACVCGVGATGFITGDAAADCAGVYGKGETVPPAATACVRNGQAV